MPKLYCLCLDAFPEIDTLKDFFSNKHLTRSDLICAGACTCCTMTSMISGTLSSEIMKHGMGPSTQYHPRFHEWRKKGKCIVDLIKQNHIFHIHNHIPWMENIILGNRLNDEQKKKHYRDRIIDNDDITSYSFGVIQKKDNIYLSSSHPDKTLNTFLEWNFDKKREEFYSNEKMMIQSFQNNNWSGIFWNDLCHWHEAVYYPNGQINNDQKVLKDNALSDSIEWLKNWDFDEPDSVFFVYADHSHRVNSILDPESYVTWVYFKDNTNHNRKLAPIIASTDFYDLAKHVFDLETEDHKKNIWLNDDFKCNRIYGCEDARNQEENKDIAITCLRAQSFDNLWISVSKSQNSTIHANGIYIIVTNLSNKYTYTVYYYENESQYKLNNFTSWTIICDGPLSDKNKIDSCTFILNDNIREVTDMMLSKFT